MADDAAYGADELARPYRDILGEGVVGANDLKVTAGAGLTVNVAAGACWIKGDVSTLQPLYRCISDGVKTLTLAGAHASLARIDLVVADVRDSAFSGSNKDWRIYAITGTPDAAPVAPALPASAIALATVPVAAAASVPGTITDQRGRAVIGGGDGLMSTHDQWKVAAFALPSGSYQAADVVFPASEFGAAAGGSLVAIPNARYEFSVSAIMGTPMPGVSIAPWMDLIVGGVLAERTYTGTNTSVAYPHMTIAGVIAAGANFKVHLELGNGPSAAATNWAVRCSMRRVA